MEARNRWEAGLASRAQIGTTGTTDCDQQGAKLLIELVLGQLW